MLNTTKHIAVLQCLMMKFVKIYVSFSYVDKFFESMIFRTQLILFDTIRKNRNNSYFVLTNTFANAYLANKQAPFKNKKARTKSKSFYK